MFCTPSIIRKARKEHKCSNCAEPILIGESYARWASFDDICTTSKMHQECLAMLDEDSDGGYFEYSPYSGERPAIGQYGRV